MQVTVFLALLIAACSRPADSVHAVSSDSARIADSTAIRVRGPTLVPFFPVVTQAQVDSSDELSTVLDDFTYHLASARDSLTRLGFVIIDRPRGLVRIRDDNGSRDITPAADSAYVGYIFIAPGRRDHLAYGVMTNSELIDAARAFLTGTWPVGVAPARPNAR